MRWFTCIAAVGAAALVVASGPASAQSRLAAADTSDWPAYERNPAHSSAVFVDSAVTTANAAGLSALWQFTADASTKSGQPARNFDASPTVVGGRVYIGSRTGMFYALDATTGAVVWRKQLDYGSAAVCPAKGIVGSATVVADPTDHKLTVYAPGAHYLYALDAATGAQRWKTSIGPATAAGNSLYFNWSSPTVVGGRIFTGLAANCAAHQIRGGVVSLNQHTGMVQHTYYDAPAGKTGASVWTSQASDGASVWVTTGNPNPNGSAVYDAYSVIRLAASTLVKQDKWTATFPLNADLDFGSSPTLFAGTVGGATTKLVGACNKNGIFYAWRQANLAAGPVWSRTVGTTSGADVGSCLASAGWDFQTHRLFIESNQTTIGGVTSPGGLRALNPSTGAVIWEKSLPCLPVGSPTLNGAIVAVPLYGLCSSGSPAVELFRESDGALLGSIPATGATFAQPVFAEGKIFIASEDGAITAFAP